MRYSSIRTGGVATDVAIGTGPTRDMPGLQGMMGSMRLMTTTFRPMNEASWG